MRRRRSLLAAPLLAAASLAACTTAPPEEPPSARTTSPLYAPCPELTAAGATSVVALWDAAHRRPLRISGTLASSDLGPEPAARALLRRHAALLGLREDGRDLELATAREGIAGTYLRFQQLASVAEGAAPLPVFEGQVIVLVAREAGRSVVRSVNLAHRAALAIAPPARDIGAEGALGAARAALGEPAENGEPEVVAGVGGEPAAVVYRVRMSTAGPDAAWEVLVDAASGAILSKRDRIARLNGNGMVFDPNPVASTGDATLADNANATSPALDAAGFSVVLPNLDGSGYLRGTWVDAHTKNLNQRAFNAGLTFNYTRADQGFEEVNAYFHLDRTQARLQSLGILSANASAQDVISDGQQGDNSYFDPAKDVINYGQGGVDDAEDADVVIHEYGHAIQEDQVPGFGAGGNAGAMGEGFGDYLATSIARVLSMQIGDPNCVAEWDATFYAMGNPPCLRRTDSTKHYPEFAVGQIHDDGEIYSSALAALDVTLGADVMNRLVLEGQFSHSTTETFFMATQSFLDADAMLYGGMHQDAIRRRMIQQGLCRILSGPSPLSNVLSSVDVAIENPSAGGLYADHLDDTQSFTAPGAEALRLHFTTIDTELDPTCLDGACDNIYLTGGSGDLYQILSGQQTNVLSVVIPGDTVFIRLVTDANTPKAGYHIDRVDVMGDGMGSGGAGGAMGGAGGAMGGAGGSMGTGAMGGAGGAMSGAGGAMSGAGGAMGGAGGSMGTGAMGGAGGAMGTGAMGGAGGAMGGAGGTAGPSGGGGTGGSSAQEPDGCGCRTAGSSRQDAPASFGIALIAAVLVRRRRGTGGLSRAA